MTTKRILVFANSIKRQRRCVAGCELIDEEAGKFRWGSWIRPVSNHDEGALDFVERRLTDGKDPKPLDVIKLSLSDPENNPLQPENWLIQVGQPWIFALPERDLFRSSEEIVAEAYRLQGEKVAYQEDDLVLREEPPRHGN
jgi:hypothetical protein